MRNAFLLPLLASLPSLVGCLSRCPEVAALEGEPSLLTVGDSLLASHANLCASIPDAVSLELGRPGENRSVGGSRVLGGDDAIPGQVVAGDWDWVIVDGGGNDLNEVCATDGEAAVIQELVDENGQEGAMPALVDRLVEGGARVALLGYYPMRDGALLGFDDCDAAFAELNQRYTDVAALREGVVFVDLGQAIDPEGTPSAYFLDGVHPSRYGATLAGELVARRIREAEQAGGEEASADP
ncbi:MAG: SGNH/GDSL hydrolase family protein [Alphaproteobacteria bacterium]|nr:SGNH/GDSL hydrolase family protein [Alphaproteobacteria bacterium]